MTGLPGLTKQPFWSHKLVHIHFSRSCLLLKDLLVALIQLHTHFPESPVTRKATRILQNSSHKAHLFNFIPLNKLITHYCCLCLAKHGEEQVLSALAPIPDLLCTLSGCPLEKRLAHYSECRTLRHAALCPHAG